MLRKTNKASLAKELQKIVSAVDVILQLSLCMTDGIALVQRLKGEHKTFSEVADFLIGTVLHKALSSQRIDVVFDAYKGEKLEVLNSTTPTKESSCDWGWIGNFQKNCVRNSRSSLAKCTAYSHECSNLMFCVKRGNIDSTQLPPCADYLFKQAFWANFKGHSGSTAFKAHL